MLASYGSRVNLKVSQNRFDLANFLERESLRRERLYCEQPPSNKLNIKKATHHVTKYDLSGAPESVGEFPS